jgi:hypothetical protein
MARNRDSDDQDSKARKSRRDEPDDDADEGEEDERPRKRKKKGGGGDAVSAVIPFRNVPALIAYYTGIFGLLTCLFPGGGLFGLVPLALGIMGLMKASKDEKARGRVHAWIGLILGALEVLLICVVVGLWGFSLGWFDSTGFKGRR